MIRFVSEMPPTIAQQLKLGRQRLVRPHRRVHGDPALAFQAPGQTRQPGDEVGAHGATQRPRVLGVEAAQHRLAAVALQPQLEPAGVGVQPDGGRAEAAQQGVLVVAQQAAGPPRIAEGPDPAEHPGCVRTPVDQVAHQHDLALGPGQDGIQPPGPAMDIADEGHAHRRA